MSASNAVMRRDILNFEANVPYDLSLKYSSGKTISNGNVMFSTSDDEIFFVKPEDAATISALSLRPYEPFRLVKRVIGNGRNPESKIVVSRIEEAPQPVSRPAAATVATAPSNHPVEDFRQSSQTQDNPLSRVMAGSYIAAIDALVIAEKYAQARGVAFRLTTGEIRSSAHCIFIAMSRQGGR